MSGGVGGAGSALGSAVTGGNSKAVVAANSSLTSAISANTQAVASANGLTTTLNTTLGTKINTALTQNNTTTGTLNTATGALTAAINRLIPAMAARGVGASFAPVGRPGGGRPGRPPRGFAAGGIVPGSGNGDTVPAMLSPGEFVIKKSAVGAFGAENLSSINRYNGGTGKQGVKKKKGAAQQVDPAQHLVVDIPVGSVCGSFHGEG